MAYNSKFTGAQIDALLDASEKMQTSKEDVANKVTTINDGATDEQYPSAKAVKEGINVGVSAMAGSVSSVAESLSTTVASISNTLTSNTNHRSDSSYYISSKLFPFGGRAKAINFSNTQYSEYEGKQIKVIVGSYLQESNKMLIRHISDEITVTGVKVDISNLNISIPPNGLIGIYNDSGVCSYYEGNANVVTFLGSKSSMIEGNTINAFVMKLALTYNVEVEENVSIAETLESSIDALEERLEIETKILANNQQNLNNLIVANFDAPTTNLPKITTKGNQVVRPLSWISSRVITYGAKVLKANFFTGSEELQGKTAYIVVGQMINDNQAKIISRTAFEVAGATIDLSDLEISIPSNGIVGINFDESSATYGYSANRPTSLEGKVFCATDASVVGNIVTQNSSLSYLNFPFNVEVLEKELITEKLDRKIIALEGEIRDFSEKACVIMGDSITWVGNDDLSGVEGWTHYFKDWFNFKSIRSYARSGATWSCTADTEYNIVENTGSLAPNNVCYNQMNRLLHDIEEGTQETPDYIIVALGTNDAWYRHSASAEGGVDVVKELFNNATNYEQDVPINTCLTVAMAIRYFSDMVANNLSNTQVILLTPLQSSSISYDNIISIGDIIEECAKYCSYPVIRQDKECGVYRIQEARGFVNTKDGTHLSSIGAEKVGNYLAQKIKNLLR